MRSRVSAVLLVAVLGLAVGCAEDEPTPAGPTASAEGPEESESAGAATPSAQPASGPEVSRDYVSYHLPEGPRWRQTSTGITAYFYRGADSYEITSGFGTARQRDPQALGEYVVKRLDDDIRPVVTGTRVAGGHEGYVVESEGGGEFVYEFGVPDFPDWYYLRFTFPKDTPQAREWIEQVLASIEWK